MIDVRQAKIYPTYGLLVLLILACPSCYRRSQPEPVHQTAPATTPQPEPIHHASPAATAQRTFPKQTGLINDFANVFDVSEEQRLNQLVSELKDIDVDFPIVTIDSTNGEPLFDYSLALARNWQPGGPSKKGLMLVLAIKDRQWRLQVSDALRSALPDQLCLELGKPSEGFYKQGKYADGVEHYVRALGARLRGHK